MSFGRFLIDAAAIVLLKPCVLQRGSGLAIVHFQRGGCLSVVIALRRGLHIGEILEAACEWENA